MLEAYSADRVAAESKADRIRKSAVRVRASGVPVRVLRAIYLPEDETSLVLFDAPSADDVRALVADAGLSIERIAVAVVSAKEED